MTGASSDPTRPLTSPTPDSAATTLWGEATDHAIRAFPITGRAMPQRFLAALIEIKRAAALTNTELGLLDADRAEAIVTASDDVLAGRWWDQFPVDIYQTGSATSSNMNANEVLAALANRQLPADRAVLPHEHVNRCQSSNDVVPTAMRIATAGALRDLLHPALADLRTALIDKATEFWEIVKIARTHLQDATPIRLGQEFWGYAGQVEVAEQRLRQALDDLADLPLGGTAVGTGLSAHPDFAERTITRLAQRLDLDLNETDNHFGSQSTLDAVIAAHGSIKTIALALFKIGCDIRLLGTGPRAGFGELLVPDVGVSSSIMPGKVPPSVIEALTMAVARVVGNDAVVGFSQVGSVLELNVMMPVVIDALLESVELLASATANFTRQCVSGLQATDVGPDNVRRSVMLTTALSAHIGYHAAAEITRDALSCGESIKEVAARHGISSEQFDQWVDPVAMTGTALPPSP